MRVAVVGGGIAGLAAAVALRQAGHEPYVFERASALREVGAGVSLWPSALGALQYLSLEDEVLTHALPHRTASIRNRRGVVLAAFNDDRIEAALGGTPVMILRPDLQRVLLKACDGLPIRTSARCVGLEVVKSSTVLLFEDGSRFSADLVVGADGVNSAVRRSIAPEDPPPRYCGCTAWRAIIRAPDLITGVWLSVGDGSEFIVTQMSGGKSYWSAAAPMAEGYAASLPSHRDYLMSHFEGWHEPIPEIIRRTPEEGLINGDIYGRPPPRWLYRKSVVLVGDAAHPMTPHLGQGACQAIEDAAVMLHSLRSQAGLKPALADFEARRLGRVRRIVSESNRLCRLDMTTNRVAGLFRDQIFRMIPTGTWVRHGAKVNGRGAFGAQMVR